MSSDPFASVEHLIPVEPSEKVQKRLGPQDAEDLVITQEQKVKIVYDEIRAKEKEFGDCKFDEVWAALCNIGLTDIGQAHAIIDKLKRDSLIYEPRDERYKIV